MTDEELRLLRDLLLVTTAFFAVLSAYLLFLLRNREFLRQKDAEYAMLLEQATDAILLFSVQGEIKHANQQACTLLQRPLDKIVGLGLCDFIEPSSEGILKQALESAQSGDDGRFDFESAIELRDGRILWLEARGRLLDENRLLVVVRDQTRRRELERVNRQMTTQLVERQRMESLGKLAGGVAHDFNNLMTVVLANADEAASRSPKHDEKIQLNLTKIVTAAQRAGELTQQLLAYSGQSAFHRAPVNVNELVHELGGLLRSAIPINVDLTWEVAPNLPRIEGDAARLRQVAMNLVLNASDSIHDSGTIIMRTSSVDPVRLSSQLGPQETKTPGVLIEVIDNGSGMTSEIKDQIFEPFFTTKSKGRGLGLSACHGIIRGHGGVLSVVSEFGGGSTFSVLLPGMPAAKDDEGTHPETHETDSTGCVLVVDDNEDVRDSTAAMLQRFGYRTVIADGGETGTELFKADPASIDCALVDLSMPGMDGHETAQALWGINPELPVILMSGFAAEHEGKRLDGNTFSLQKPFTPDSLRDRVQRALGEIVSDI